MVDDVMLLDAWDNVYIWVGENARQDEKEGAEKLAMVCTVYILKTGHGS